MFIANLDRSIACVELHLVRVVPDRVVLGRDDLGVVVPISKVAVLTLGAVVEHVGVVILSKVDLGVVNPIREVGILGKVDSGVVFTLIVVAVLTLKYEIGT